MRRENERMKTLGCLSKHLMLSFQLFLVIHHTCNYGLKAEFNFQSLTLLHHLRTPRRCSISKKCFTSYSTHAPRSTVANSVYDRAPFLLSIYDTAAIMDLK